MENLQFHEQLRKQKTQSENEREMIVNEFFQILSTRNQQIQTLSETLRNLSVFTTKIKNERDKLVEFLNNHEFGSFDVEILEKERKEKQELIEKNENLESTLNQKENQLNQVKIQYESCLGILEENQNQNKQIIEEKEKIQEKNTQDNLLLLSILTNWNQKSICYPKKMESKI
ncbi:hypothetical protein M0811_04781 [Anaeramoeba ignava]|uniref:Uncharacterized protein n=1 Tax=Anaeramoeba ignava TaxID=1746090 RepID=A0A9Q0LRF4_ANAIG|nr:hypothetical protein M0811_04781 [Anaeramoeba ignava]